MRRYSISVRRLFAVLSFSLLLALFACAAQARVKFVPPGQTPKLDADEGLVAIVIDTNSSLRDVRFRKDGKLFDSATIKNVQPGATPRLYIVPAGEYEWSRANTFFSMWYEFKDSPDTKFRVEPGVLNYPGDLLMRGVYTKTADFRFSNRSLQLMDWLEEFHPKILSNYEFSYRGHYPEPFPKFYREAKAANGKPFSELGFALEPPAAGTLPGRCRYRSAIYGGPMRSKTPTSARPGD